MKGTTARKLRQIPHGYLIIEIDPHKKRHAAVVITQDFTTLVKFKSDNSREGFEMMLQQTITLCNEVYPIHTAYIY